MGFFFYKHAARMVFLKYKAIFIIEVSAKVLMLFKTLLD